MVGRVRGLASSCVVLAGVFALGATPGLCGSPKPEKIQATYAEGGAVISITLNIYDYTTPSEMQTLSRAFEQGQDQGLAAALSTARAAGNCSITGEPGFDVAFIQAVVTPTGRQITFITNRRLHFDEARARTEPEPFDLLVGQFDINDADNTKSTGFIFPASRLMIDSQGELHYDLAGNPWSLVDILDSNGDPALALRQAPDAISRSSQ